MVDPADLRWKVQKPDIRYLVNTPEECQQKCAYNPNFLSWTYKKTAGEKMELVAQPATASIRPTWKKS